MTLHDTINVGENMIEIGLFLSVGFMFVLLFIILTGIYMLAGRPENEQEKREKEDYKKRTGDK